MSDEALRVAERRWHASGSVDDEALLLREQVRVGALQSSRLKLAAVLGHPAAVIASGQAAAPLDGTFRDVLRDEIRGDTEVMVRVCIAVAIHLMRNMPGEAEHDPGHERHESAAMRELKRVCVSCRNDDLDVVAAASAAASFSLRPFDTETTAWTCPELVREIAGLTFFGWPTEKVETCKAIARGLIPWLLGRGDQVVEWLARDVR